MDRFKSDSRKEQLNLTNVTGSDKLPEERGERLDSGFQSFTSILSCDRNSLTPSLPPLSHVIEEPGPDLERLDEGIAFLSLPTETDKKVGDFHISDTGNNSIQQLSDFREEELELLRIFSEDEDGDTKLHIAVIQNEIELVKYFIKVAQKYDICNELDLLESQNKLSQTPLHLAVLTENSEVTACLMATGASASLQDHNGDSPLHIACRGCQEEIVCLILESTDPSKKQELLETVNYDGKKCIHECNSNEHIQIISKLRGNGVNVNSRDNKAGWTLLHMAADCGNAKLVSYLIMHTRVNLEQCTFNDVTALMLAESRGKHTIVSILETAGSQYNKIDSDQESDDET